MPRSQESIERRNAAKRQRRRERWRPRVQLYPVAKQIILRELERQPQTKHAISAATGLKFKTVEGTITRLADAGVVHSDSVDENEFRSGPKRKIYRVGQA